MIDSPVAAFAEAITHRYEPARSRVTGTDRVLRRPLRPAVAIRLYRRDVLVAPQVQLVVNRTEVLSGPAAIAPGAPAVERLVLRPAATVAASADRGLGTAGRHEDPSLSPVPPAVAGFRPVARVLNGAGRAGEPPAAPGAPAFARAGGLQLESGAPIAELPPGWTPAPTVAALPGNWTAAGPLGGGRDVEVERLTQRVIKALDRRAVALQERMDRR